MFDHLTRGVALAACRQRERAQRVAQAKWCRRCAARFPPATSASAIRRPIGSLSEAEFIQGVHRTKEYIAAGDVYQLVLSVRFAGAVRAGAVRDLSRAATAESLAVHVLLRSRRLRRRRLLARSAREAVARPRADAADRGHAAARSATARDDALLQEELLADPKENAEHIMLVDLARNDLGRVAQRRHRRRESVSAASSATAT